MELVLVELLILPEVKGEQEFIMVAARRLSLQVLVVVQEALMVQVASYTVQLALKVELEVWAGKEELEFIQAEL